MPSATRQRSEMSFGVTVSITMERSDRGDTRDSSFGGGLPRPEVDDGVCLPYCINWIETESNTRFLRTRQLDSSTALSSVRRGLEEISGEFADSGKFPWSLEVWGGFLWLRQHYQWIPATSQVG